MIRNTLPGLDFALGGDVDMLRETVGSFAQAKIAPRAEDIDRSNKFPRDLWPELGALGLLGITVEEEWGVVFADCEVPAEAAMDTSTIIRPGGCCVTPSFMRSAPAPARSAGC